ncbi:MAG: PocR ligand-binding domain-containing protein [Caldilineales bacterium]|nr:PocR ligand-binding domain-containing protein [Caldilineales bacterium]
MAELLTTKQLQEILLVDRTTIYRMADSGRIPGIKVGNQWRFPKNQIEAWLQTQGGAMPIEPINGNAGIAHSHSTLSNEQIFPIECVQLIQDSFADILGVMILVTDLDGNLITQPSNPCGLFTAAESSPTAHKRCLETWMKLAQEPGLAPRFMPSHLGLLCARGLIRVGSKIQAMLIVGGIAPEVWPPDEAETQRIADDLDIDVRVVRQHINHVHRLSKDEQARVLPYVQRIADIFAHIANERSHLFERLQRIAEITKI